MCVLLKYETGSAKIAYAVKSRSSNSVEISRGDTRVALFGFGLIEREAEESQKDINIGVKGAAKPKIC